jgi:hypothetical protein
MEGEEQPRELTSHPKTPAWYEKWKMNLPVRRYGDWSIIRFTVTEEDERLGRLRAAFSFSSGGRYTPAGEYTALKHRGETVMSDVPDEMRDLLEVVRRAKGKVLVNGLGLGVVLKALLEKDEVEEVTVIEKELAVIELVGRHFRDKYGDSVKIIHADAFEYKPPIGVHYDVVWHDIWNDICAKNLTEIHKLHRKYGRRCDWQGSWCRRQCERLRG